MIYWKVFFKIERDLPIMIGIKGYEVEMDNESFIV